MEVRGFEENDRTRFRISATSLFINRIDNIIAYLLKNIKLNASRGLFGIRIYYIGMLITRKYYDMSCFVFEKPDTFGKTFALRMQRIFFCKRVTSF